MNHLDISGNNSHTNYVNVKEYTWDNDITSADLLDIMDDLDKPIVIRGLFKNTNAYNKWNIENIENVFNDISFNTVFKADDIDSLCKWFNSSKKTVGHLLEYYRENSKNTSNIRILHDLNYNSNDTPHRINKDKVKKEIINDININGIDSVVFDKAFSTLLSITKNASDEMKFNNKQDIVISQLIGETDYYLCETNKNTDIIKEKSIKDIIPYPDDDYRFPSHYSENNKEKYNFFELDHSLFTDLYKVKLNSGDTILIPPCWWYSNKDNGITTSIIKVNTRENFNFLLDHPNIILNYYLSGKLTEEIYLFIYYTNIKYWLIIIFIGFLIAIHTILTCNNYYFISILYIYTLLFLFIIIILPTTIKYIYNDIL